MYSHACISEGTDYCPNCTWKRVINYITGFLLIWFPRSSWGRGSRGKKGGAAVDICQALLVRHSTCEAYVVNSQFQIRYDAYHGRCNERDFSLLGLARASFAGALPALDCIRVIQSSTPLSLKLCTCIHLNVAAFLLLLLPLFCLGWVWVLPLSNSVILCLHLGAPTLSWIFSLSPFVE